MQIFDMMRKLSDSKAKWKAGLSKLRRQSVVSETSVGETTVMDEETTELEMQDYFTKLKKKTGLNQLWSGRKFMETIDKDPDIDLSEEPRLRTETLKQLTLDSDEEDLHDFIQNLSDYERSHMTEEEDGNSRSSSSASDINLMKNINFAEAGAVDFSTLDKESNNDDGDDNNDQDFMPLVVKPDFYDGDGDSDHTEISQGNIFKTGNINFISSDVSSVRMVTEKDRSVEEDVASEADGTVAELTEEIPEVDHGSRARTPATPVKSHDYTSSKFESYDSNEMSESRESMQSHTSKSTSQSRNVEKYKGSVRKPHTKYSEHSHSERVRRRKRRNSKKPQLSDKSESLNKSISKGISRGTSAYLSSSLSSTRSSESSSDTKSRGTKSLKHKEKDNISGKRKEKRHFTSSHQKKTLDLKVSLNDLGMINTEMLVNSVAATKYLDPSPIATTVVDHDALEAVTSYNPTMLALNDLLRYQVQLTRQHIDNSWRLYRAYADPEAKGTHKYTTLKDTMKYLKKNAPSVITYEEALKQINSEHE